MLRSRWMRRRPPAISRPGFLTSTSCGYRKGVASGVKPVPDDRVRDLTDPEQAIAWLRTPEAIRERCHSILDLGTRGELAHFTVDMGRIEAAAGFVAEVTRRNYPDLNIPYHARWRHFAAGGI